MFFSCLKNEKGQAVVEMALVLPLLITIMCGIIDFGWIFMNRYEVEQAAYAGARYASMEVANDATMDETALGTKVETYIAPALGKKASTPGKAVIVKIESENVKVTVRCPIKTLTFIGQICLGGTYTAECSDVAAK